MERWGPTGELRTRRGCCASLAGAGVTAVSRNMVMTQGPYPLPFWPVLLCVAAGSAVLRVSPLGSERLLLNHAKTPGFLAPGGEEFNPGPETRLDRSELLCNKVLLKYKGDKESF